jgi:hypothetical protein
VARNLYSNLGRTDQQGPGPAAVPRWCGGTRDTPLPPRRRAGEPAAIPERPQHGPEGSRRGVPPASPRQAGRPLLGGIVLKQPVGRVPGLGRSRQEGASRTRAGSVMGLTLLITGPPPRELPGNNDNGLGGHGLHRGFLYRRVRGFDPVRQLAAFPGGLHLTGHRCSGTGEPRPRGERERRSPELCMTSIPIS